MKKTFRKLLASFLAVIMILSVSPMSGLTKLNFLDFTTKSSALTSGDFKYEVTDGKATLTGYYGTATSVTIPSTLGGYSVTSIGYRAFYYYVGRKNITSITIPNSVINIGEYAFEDCTGLTNITIPNSVTSIGAGAFGGCTGLTNITIPNSVTSIGAGAFGYCTGLVSITIPNKVTIIGEGAFEGCTGLISATIGNSVTSVGTSAFYECRCLTSITIPNSVESIGDSAFYNCRGLTSATIGSSVTNIGKEAFSNCINLNNITILSDSSKIHQKAFYNTGYYNNEKNWENTVLYLGQYLIDTRSTLSGEYYIKDGTRVIADWAFYGQRELTNIVFPNSVAIIGETSICRCDSIKSLILPNSIKCIDFNAFNEIPLETIYYNGTVEQWNNIDINYSSTNSGFYYPTGYYSLGYGYFYGIGGQTKIYCTGSSTTYTVNYNANGGSVSPTSATVNIGSSTKLPTPTKNFKLIFNANGGTNAPAAQNFPVTCKGWSTSSTATSATYSCGASYKPSSSTTLYAVWNSSSESAKITTAVPTRSGYKFLGWGSSSTDTAPKHKSGDSIYLTGGDVTLFAVWEKISTPTDPDLKDAIFIRTKEMNLDKKDVTAALSTIVIADKYNTTDYTFEFECSKPNALQYDIEMKEDNETYFLALGQNGVTGTFKFYVRLYKTNGHILIDEDYITVNVRDSVYYETISLNYKNSYQLNFNSSEFVFETNNSSVATVDENGKIYASGTGSTVVMAVDTVDYGVHYYKVDVSYSFLQYLILIFLFGWLWY